MTIEKHHSITLDEIRSVQFECKKCEMKLSIPMQSDRHVPDICPHCQHRWFEVDQRQRSFWEKLYEFRQAVKVLSGIPGEIGCVLSVEIKGDEDVEGD